MAAARAIYGELDPRRRRQLLGTMALMVVGAFAEMATIGAVLPFLAIVSPGATVGRYGWLVAPVNAFALWLGTSPVAGAAILLVGIVTVAAALRLTLLWVSQLCAFAIAHDLSRTVYDRVLHRPYTYHVVHNSAETLAAMEKVQFVLGNVLLPFMAGSTAAIVSVFILAALVAIDPATALIAGFCFVLLYAMVSRLTRARLYRNADIIAASVKQRVQTLQEGLGGIRDVLLDGSQPVFLAKFTTIDSRFRDAQATNQFIAAAPRFIVEAAGVMLIAALSVAVSARPGGLAAALPVLGALALGAQRLLPLVQQVYFSGSQIYGHRATLIDVAQLLESSDAAASLPPPASTPAFSTAVVFEGVGYRYPTGTVPALVDISLEIERGARVGLIGKSGSGKSTLVDLLMGLLDVDCGRMLIDGQPLTPSRKPAWQAQLAHVPQAIFLADGSIAANIAFGQDEAAVDRERVADAARRAGLGEFVASLPQGLDTAVGERGVRLSGGQRQRIGIARALFKQASVLVFDEATSALDDATEASVMAAIADLPRTLTIVIIAHRLTTLRMCDKIVRLEDGRIAGVGPYQELIGQLIADTREAG